MHAFREYTRAALFEVSTRPDLFGGLALSQQEHKGRGGGTQGHHHQSTFHRPNAVGLQRGQRVGPRTSGDGQRRSRRPWRMDYTSIASARPSEQPRQRLNQLSALALGQSGTRRLPVGSSRAAHHPAGAEVAGLLRRQRGQGRTCSSQGGRGLARGPSTSVLKPRVISRGIPHHPANPSRGGKQGRRSGSPSCTDKQ